MKAEDPTFDAYIPRKEHLEILKKKLMPFERLLKKTCYTNKLARIARFLADMFVDRKKVVFARYFDLLEDIGEWIEG